MADPTRPSATETEYFKSIPWCADLISSHNTALFTPTCRQPDSSPSGTKDQLVRKTLNDPKAIPHCIGLYTKPVPVNTTETPESLSLYIQSASLFFDLQPGVNGFNGTAHGGLIATLIDEVMGSLIFINNIVQTQLEREGGSLPPGTLDLNNTRVLTASMTVRFQKPVPTPGVVVATARFVGIEGRKISFDVRVHGEDKGVEYARGDGLWVSLPLQKV